MTGNETEARERRAIDAVKGGDGAAYGYLVEKHMGRVLSIAWGIVRNASDAEDLAQDAFVKAYQSIEGFNDGAPFAPWIHRIVTNLALDVLKKRKHYAEEGLQGNEVAARRDSASLPAQSNELAARIDVAIERLPGMQRIVARLFLVEQFDHAEIAAMTGLADGTVRSHLSLARGKLKDELADLYGGSDE